jgi:EAL domain-containing protein (putative c-di-GMP-specific phosphodiesterase class I)
MAVVSLPVAAPASVEVGSKLACCIDDLNQAVRLARIQGSRLAVFFIATAHPVQNLSSPHPILSNRLIDAVQKCVGEEGGCAQFHGANMIAFMPDVLSDSHLASKMDELRHTCEAIIGRSPAAHPVLIGSTVYPDDNADVSQLMIHAYTAMLDNLLSSGQTCQLFDFASQSLNALRSKVTSEVLQAIAESRILVYFQPKVDLHTGRPVGAEALVRMERHDGSIAEPAEFLPYIRSEYCLLELDCYILETALRQAMIWANSGMHLAMSVNVSARLFNNRAFTERTLELLDQFPEFDPTKLVLEVLENLDMTDLSLANALFAELRAQGVKIYLDDYGTGRSSAAYLKLFEVDGIKIDRTFVRELHDGENNARDRAIIAAAVEVAKAFELNVVAEGVETHGAARELINLGITTGQGFFYARPMPASQFAHWYEDTNLCRVY